jgi:hypothetical protein
MEIIDESEIEDDLISQFEGVANEGKELIASSNHSDSVVSKINDYVTEQSKLEFEEDFDAWTDLALPLGTLWGEMFVEEYDWEWIRVHFEDGSKAIGVFSKDRSIGIYPWYFVLGCVENGAPVTILLAWNMLKEGAIPTMEPKSYTNLMDGVHHIIPPI